MQAEIDLYLARHATTKATIAQAQRELQAMQQQQQPREMRAATMDLGDTQPRLSDPLATKAILPEQDGASG